MFPVRTKEYMSVSGIKGLLVTAYAFTVVAVSLTRRI